MDLSDTESLEAEPTATPLPAQSASSFAAARSAMAQSAAAAAQDAPSEEEEETPTPAPVKRGRPKGSKDAQPRTRTKPVHTPSKQYTHDTVHQNSPTELRCEAPSLRHYEEAMEHARQREVNRRQTMYASWLPY